MTRWINEEQIHQTPNQPSFAADLMSLGPASTMNRELLAAVTQIGAVVLLLFVVFPDRLVEPWRWLLLVATIIYFTVRFATGISKWRHR
ncbi:hypothetical protein [Rothia nasimurium]|uniref:hypothetical protein n=1 Tax=Rothia nasimurium TaxID=85336 RepID=UPI001624D2CB|nr:hypothetical protein [Rothia nasimurium]